MRSRLDPVRLRYRIQEGLLYRERALCEIPLRGEVVLPTRTVSGRGGNRDGQKQGLKGSETHDTDSTSLPGRSESHPRDVPWVYTVGWVVTK